MRNLKPKIKIDKFSGSGEGMLYYNEGFIAGNENGNSLLSEGYNSYKIFNSKDTNYSSFDSYEKVLSMANVRTKIGGLDYQIGVTSSGKIITLRDNTATYISDFWLGTGLGRYQTSSNYPDIFELPSGNLMYTSSGSISFIVRGYCATGSSSTKIVDGEGRNFTTLYGPTKVINLRTGQVYTITDISTTTSDDDTIEFSAVSGKTNNVNDEFLAISYNRMNFHENSLEARRQIVSFADYFYILNQNWLSRIEGDEQTFTQKSKQLPSGQEALSISVNSGKMLISSTKSNSENYLLLWDGYSDGWNNWIKVSSEVYALQPYNNGWIYFIRGELFYTDGFSTQKLSSYVDNKKVGLSKLAPKRFNAITEANGIIYMVASYNGNSPNKNRSYTGVYACDLEGGWSFLNSFIDNKLYGRPECIYYYDNNNMALLVGMESGVSAIEINSSTNEYISKSFITYIELKEETQIYGVGLVITQNHNIEKDSLSSGGGKTDITVNIGDGKENLITYGSGASLQTSSVRVSKQSNDTAEIGDLIIPTNEFSVGAFNTGIPIRGERVYIKNIIDDSGYRYYEIEPNFTTNINNVMSFKLLKVKKCDRKVIDSSEFNREQMFFISKPLYTNKIFIEVVVHGITNSIPISITGINIY